MADEKRPASDEFVEAFRLGIGTTDALCELCGRHIFGNGYGYEPGEFEALQRKAKERPDRYVEWACDGVSLGEIDGERFVVGCCPENLRKYEEWILKNRHAIVQYLKARAARRLEEAQADADDVQGLEE